MTGKDGTAASETSSLITGPDFIITSNPQDQRVILGGVARFEVTTEPDIFEYDNFTFVWEISRDNGNTWSRATDRESDSSLLTISNVDITTNNLKVRVQVSVPGKREISQEATLTVVDPDIESPDLGEITDFPSFSSRVNRSSGSLTGMEPRSIDWLAGNYYGYDDLSDPCKLEIKTGGRLLYTHMDGTNPVTRETRIDGEIDDWAKVFPGDSIAALILGPDYNYGLWRYEINARTTNEIGIPIFNLNLHGTSGQLESVDASPSVIGGTCKIHYRSRDEVSEPIGLPILGGKLSLQKAVASDLPPFLLDTSISGYSPGGQSPLPIPATCTIDISAQGRITVSTAGKTLSAEVNGDPSDKYVIGDKGVAGYNSTANFTIVANDSAEGGASTDITFVFENYGSHLAPLGARVTTRNSTDGSSRREMTCFAFP